MKRRVFGLALALLGPASLKAQDSTAALLQQARQLYEQVDVERALTLLRQVVSPGWPFPVTAQQRVEAYKYLGAALSLRNQSDSAVVYFRAALERDPFTDLDPTYFTPAQVALFAQARRLSFATAVRPVAATHFDPRSERLPITVATTHTAALEVRLRGLGGQGGVVLFSGASEGLREVGWNGLLSDGRLAPAGRYEVLVVGQSRLVSSRDTARVYLDVEQHLDPLEDTLRALGPGDLLPEQATPSVAKGDLLKGLGVAAAAVLIADGFSNRDLGRGMPAASWSLAGVAIAVGGASFVHRRQHRDLPANVVENARRRATRDTTNAAIVRRNAERIARTILVITPAAGTGP
jgi:hypothetical protein